MPEPKDTQIRGPVKLPVKKGTALLKKGNLPAIDCPVTNVSVTGCTCRIKWAMVEPSKHMAWKMALDPGQVIELNLTMPPYLFSMDLRGRVVHAQSESNVALELTLNFLDVANEAAANLAKAADLQKGSEPAPALTSTQQLELKSGNPRESQLMALAERCRGKPLEELVLTFKRATPAQIENAQKYSIKFGGDLGSCLLKLGILTTTSLARIYALQSGLPLIPTGALRLPPVPPEGCDYSFMSQHGCIPMQAGSQRIFMAVGRPPDAHTHLTFEQTLKKPVSFYIAPINEIQNLLFKAATDNQFSRRKFARYKTSLSLLFQLCDHSGVAFTPKMTQGKTIDISEGGIAIEAPPGAEDSLEKLLARSPWCRIAFYFPPHQIRALGKICHIQHSQGVNWGSSKWIFGVEIMEISEQDRTALQKVCATLETIRQKDLEKGIKGDRINWLAPPT